jgi:hypothetical protein
MQANTEINDIRDMELLQMITASKNGRELEKMLLKRGLKFTEWKKDL